MLLKSDSEITYEGVFIMTRIKWQGLVVVILITALLASSCGLFNPWGDDFIHRASAEIKGEHEGPLLDYEKSPYEFERVEYYELGENAAEIEDIEMVWNEHARFISDELADKILEAEARTDERVIYIEIEEEEAVYEPKEMLVHAEKKVAYWVYEKEDEPETVIYTLVRAHLKEVFETFEIPEQTVYLNVDNEAFVAEGVRRVSGGNDQSPSKVNSPFVAPTAYAAGADSEEEEEEEEEFIYEIDYEFFDGDITVEGRVELILPHADVRYKAGLFTYDDDFDIAFTAGEEFELGINGDISFEEDIKYNLVNYGLDIGDVGQCKLGVYLVIDVNGNISFEYTIEQRAYVRAGIRGEKGRIFPKIATIRPYADIDSNLEVIGNIEGELYAKGGIEVGLYFNIFDYDLAEATALVAVEALAEFTVQLTEPYDRCFILAMNFVFESEGKVLYPKVEIDWSWDMLWNWDRYAIETDVYEFDIWKPTPWLIYEFERCGEESGDFETGEQALEQDNLFHVKSVGASDVPMSSTTDHGGTTNYTTQVAPGSTFQLEAPEYVGSGSQRKRFDRWGLFGITARTISFPVEARGGNLTLRAHYVDDPDGYTLLVGTAFLVNIDSPTGHGGSGVYRIDGIAPGTTVTLTAPETSPWTLTSTLFESPLTDYYFEKWSGTLSSSSPEISFNMDSDVTLYAHYSSTQPDPDSFNLRVNMAAESDLPIRSFEGNITSDTGHGGRTPYTIGDIEAGTGVHLEAPQYVGSLDNRHSFSHWSGDVSNTSRSINFSVDHNKAVTANYVPDPAEMPTGHTLTVNSTGDDRVGVDITSKTGHGGTTNYQVVDIDPQTNVHLEAPEYLGSGAERKSFNSWSGAVESKNREITFNMDGEKAVTAHYVADPEVIEEPDDPVEPPEKYTLSVKSSADDPSMKIGVDITSKTGHSGRTPYTIKDIEAGTEVHLEAPESTEQAGSFSSWTGAVSDTNRSITFTMDADKTITANYWLEIF